MLQESGFDSEVFAKWEGPLYIIPHQASLSPEELSLYVQIHGPGLGELRRIVDGLYHRGSGELQVELRRQLSVYTGGGRLLSGWGRLSLYYSQVFVCSSSNSTVSSTVVIVIVVMYCSSSSSSRSSSRRRRRRRRRIAAEELAVGVAVLVILLLHFIIQNLGSYSRAYSLLSHDGWFGYCTFPIVPIVSCMCLLLGDDIQCWRKCSNYLQFGLGPSTSRWRNSPQSC